MKRLLCLVAALLLALPAALAAPEDLIASAKSHLTEIYGYTMKEAEQFEFSFDGKDTLRFWHKDHPEWVYTANNRPRDPDTPSATSPFYTGQFFGYPGENDIRWVLNAARETGWFKNWDQAAMAAFREALRKAANIRVSVPLALGLEAGDITAAQAVEGFFRSCLGEPYQWTAAARQWRDWVLKENGLLPEKPYLAPDGLAVTVNSRRSGDFIITHFEDNIPDSLTAAFSHPQLAGWVCLGGVTQEQQVQGKPTGGSGIAGFEKAGKRLLVMLFKDKEATWQVVPVGDNALYQNRAIHFTMDNSFYSMRIDYPLPDGELEAFTVMPVRLDKGMFVCEIESYLHINLSPGHSLKANKAISGWRLVETLPDGLQAQAALENAAVFGYLDAISDISAFPRTPEAWFKAMEGRLIPEGYAMLAGVNLREKTSSRSASLGEFKPGTLAKLLGFEQGDPYPWLHAQIGLKTGYASTSYVNPPASEFGNATSATQPLPVAQAKKDMALKSGTGLFDGTLRELPAGTRMHVLCEEKGWLYVSVPRGEAGWLMDVEGTYGYVKPGEVSLAATSLQLDWLE